MPVPACSSSRPLHLSLVHTHPVRVKDLKAEAGEMAGKGLRALVLAEDLGLGPAAGWQPIVCNTYWAEEVM